MSIIYPQGIEPDDATKARTEEFFAMMHKDKPRDEKYLFALVKQGICLEARQEDGRTPLHLAVWCDCYDLTSTLLAAGADLEARSRAYRTPLINAAFHGRTALIEVLIAAGANIEARCCQDRTALNWADREGRRAPIDALIKRGANVYACNLNDIQPLHNELVKDRLNTDDSLSLYESFIYRRHPSPLSVEEVYKLLAVTPLAEPYAPVDYAGNLRRIFAHAKWEDKQQAEGILKEMQQHGTILAETAESILAATFLSECARRPQPRSAGAAI